MNHLGILFGADGFATAAWYWPYDDQVCSALYPVGPGDLLLVIEGQPARALRDADLDQPIFSRLRTWTLQAVRQHLGAEFTEQLHAVPTDLPAPAEKTARLLHTGARVIVDAPLMDHDVGPVPDVRHAVAIATLPGAPLLVDLIGGAEPA